MRRLLLVPGAALPAQNVFGRDLNPRDYRRHLGQTRDHLAWDAGGGLCPNAFAALAATLGDGHDLLLHLPGCYPGGDPDHLRLLDYGEDPGGCRDHFNRRLRRLIGQKTASAAAPAADDICHSQRPQIILGRRGRGKTTRLAAKIRWLGQARILIVTSYRSNLERLRALLPQAPNHRYLPPDDALRRLPPADHLIIDEASAIPAAQLLALTAHYPAYTLAASEDGYEGHGRRFTLHVLPELTARDGATIHRHRHALRHPHHDPLEQHLENAFLLHPETSTPRPPTTVRRISRDERAADEHLLRATYGLLHQAHYRTSPEDLKQLLDLPGQHLYIAENHGDIAGVLHIREENPLPQALAAAVSRGERRPQGRLLLQQLLCHSQDLRHNRPLARISRIAVHPVLRRQGIAAALINHARRQIGRPLGVSYGHNAELASFWQALGFHEIHRSQSDRDRPTSLRLSLERF